MDNLIVSPVRRLGRKNKMMDVLLSFFPKNIKIFIEPFCGSGAVGLNVKSNHKFLNDLDDNIFDAFMVFSDLELKKKLVRYLMKVPYSDSVFAYFRKLQPRNIIQKVAKFLILSGWGYMRKPETLNLGNSKSKTSLIQQINKIYLHLAKDDIKWASKPFDAFLKSISIEDTDYSKAFLYCDPPYLFTTNNYNVSPKDITEATRLAWGVEDFKKVVDCAMDFGRKGGGFAISEFDNEVVQEVVKEKGLFVTPILKRRNMKNERVEILITNYDVSTIGKQEVLF